MHSPDWINLPQFLLEPLMAQALSLAEALALHQALEEAPDEEWTQLPSHLFPAAEKLWLWEAEVDPTLH